MRQDTLLDCDILIFLTWYNFVGRSCSYNSYMPVTTYVGHDVHSLNHEKQFLVLTLSSFYLAVCNFPCHASLRTVFNNCSSYFDLSSCFAFVTVTSSPTASHTVDMGRLRLLFARRKWRDTVARDGVTVTF